MKVRGNRQCRDCGAEWSYYDTGSITCPECGSPMSVGIGERKPHTDTPVGLDLTSVRTLVDEQPLRVVADEAVTEARAYVRKRGFVSGGRIQAVPDEYLAAAELAELGAELADRMRIDEAEEHYFLDLLAGADQDTRPPLDEVPASLRAPRGRAIASVAETFQRDIRRVLEDPEPMVTEVLSSIRTHQKRIAALDGDVDPADSETLVRTIRDLGSYLRTGEETALARAADRL